MPVHRDEITYTFSSQKLLYVTLFSNFNFQSGFEIMNVYSLVTISNNTIKKPK